MKPRFVVQGKRWTDAVADDRWISMARSLDRQMCVLAKPARAAPPPSRGKCRGCVEAETWISKNREEIYVSKAWGQGGIRFVTCVFLVKRKDFITSVRGLWKFHQSACFYSFCVHDPI